MMFRIRQLAGAIVAIIFLTAPTLASDALRAPVGGGIACHLLTPAQLSALLGVEVGVGRQVVPGEEKSCAWRETGKETGTPYVEVELLTAEDYDRIRKFADVSPTGETNVGEEAFFIRTAVNGFSLIVKIGRTYFSVHAKPFNRASQVGAYDEDCKSVERSIAREITGQT